MQILTVNTGSASVKLAAFEARGAMLEARDSAQVDPSGESPQAALAAFAARSAPPDAVVHRVVHGGPDLVRPMRLEAGVIEQIRELGALAPLHNPAAVRWIEACTQRFGSGTAQVAVFDTAYYAQLPEVAAHYALPGALTRQHRIRRYGFHGIAHQAMWRRWCALRPDLDRGGRLISLQLGGGCSITAVAAGAPRDTSMGFSPTEGLMMATRCGDLDPAVVTYLMRTAGLAPGRIEALLNEHSGLLGVSGRSADMRALLGDPDPAARLAIELYCYRVRKYVGAYLAVLEGADGVVFGGGVGEHAPTVRARILDPLGWAGIALDEAANAAALGREARIGAGAVDVRVLPVDEARILAEEALHLLDR